MKQTERQYLGQIALVSGAPAVQTFDFPKSELIHTIWLHIKATLTTTGAGTNYVAMANPILELINNIEFKVDRDGHSHRAPAKALYMAALVKYGVLPRIDNASYAPNTPAAYAMSVSIPLMFSDPKALRPEDTALAMDRYTTALLYVTLGAATDANKAGVGTGTTFALSGATCDVEIEKYAGAVRATVRPIVFPVWEIEGSAKNIASDALISLQRSGTRAIKRLFAFVGNLAVLARPWSGNGSNAEVASFQFESDQRVYDYARTDEAILNEMKLFYGMTAADFQAGLFVFDYVKDGSTLSAIATGDKGRLELKFVAEGSPTAGINCVSCLTEAVHQLQ